MLCLPRTSRQECVSSILVRAKIAGRVALRLRLLVPLIATSISLEDGLTLTPKSAMDLGKGVVRLPTCLDTVKCVSAIRFGLATSVYPAEAFFVYAAIPRCTEWMLFSTH